ncbi:hypothetical protein NIES4071_24950 [Calothrix sp. NIES-4071]|nr:hypothetical protein NIES4071_24950 [Calothrix sp. NIES-4071]BAZ56818.1 hypothetical protein NIES4105_24890 [Calothrix sp. NIES-4105]
MTDLIQRQEIFTQDDIATRLSNIAKNLRTINQVVVSNPDCASKIIRESLFFIEWTAPSLVQVDVNQATELVELGRTLAHWQYNWEKISKQAPAREEVATVAANLLKHNIFS